MKGTVTMKTNHDLITFKLETLSSELRIAKEVNINVIHLLLKILKEEQLRSAKTSTTIDTINTVQGMSSQKLRTVDSHFCNFISTAPLPFQDTARSRHSSLHTKVQRGTKFHVFLLTKSSTPFNSLYSQKSIITNIYLMTNTFNLVPEI